MLWDSQAVWLLKGKQQLSFVLKARRGTNCRKFKSLRLCKSRNAAKI